MPSQGKSKSKSTKGYELPSDENSQSDLFQVRCHLTIVPDVLKTCDNQSSKNRWRSWTSTCSEVKSNSTKTKSVSNLCIAKSFNPYICCFYFSSEFCNFLLIALRQQVSSSSFQDAPLLRPRSTTSTWDVSAIFTTL